MYTNHRLRNWECNQRCLVFLIYRFRVFSISKRSWSMNQSRCLSNESRTAEDHCQECHPYVDTVLSLPEVGSTWIRIEFRANLEHSRQRMHHHHLPFRTRHQLRRYHEVSAHLQTFERMACIVNKRNKFRPTEMTRESRISRWKKNLYLIIVSAAKCD